jgi:Flp pilus assembly pilin Flp
MLNCIGRLRRFANDEGAATAIEYALIAGGISIAIVGSLNAVGSTLVTNYYDKITAGFAEAGGSSGGPPD